MQELTELAGRPQEQRPGTSYWYIEYTAVMLILLPGDVWGGSAKVANSKSQVMHGIIKTGVIAYIMTLLGGIFLFCSNPICFVLFPSRAITATCVSGGGGSL